MTNDEINIAIAEACGWSRGWTGETQWVVDPNGIQLGWSKLREVADSALPDYCNDLNAMHEAEKSEDMTFNQKWIESIIEIALRESALTIERTDGWDWVAFVSRLTARQRAEAFLNTLNLWKP